MTEKDKELINKAKSYHFTDWEFIPYLIEQADTEEAKNKMRDIMKSYYHRDESYNGMG